LIENQRQIKKEPIQYFSTKRKESENHLNEQNDSSVAAGKVNSSNGGMANEPTAANGGIPFVSSMTIKHLYEILNVR
jgi:hypothetical protein